MLTKTTQPDHRRRDPLLGTIATLRHAPFKALQSLKTKRTYNQTKQLHDHLQAYNLTSHFYGISKVTTWNRISDRHHYDESADLVQELGWLAHGLRHYGPAINSYLTFRKSFGAAYLLGNYEVARDILAKALIEHGCSYWLAERELMLLQADNGFEAHKERLAELQKQLDQPLSSYIVTMFSNRLEPHVTHELFTRNTHKALADLRKDGRLFLASIIEFQVSPWTHEWIEHANNILCWYESKTLIDRYNAVVKVFSHISADSFTQPQKQALARILEDLIEVISDNQLLHIKWALIGSVDATAVDEATELYYCAYDHFLTGNFKECAELAESLIKNNPAAFDYYWLLARNYACSSETLSPSIDAKSLSFRILHALQHVAENRIDLGVPLASLQTIALKLGDNHLGLSLSQFAERESSGEISREACRFASITSKLHNPESLYPGDNWQFQKTCIEYLLALYQKHPSIKFYLFKHNLLPDGSELPPEIIKGFADIAYAEVSAAKGKHEDVLAYVKPILTKEDGDLNQRLLFAGDVSSLEFNALIALDKPIDAAESVVRNYLTNDNLLRHIRFEELIRGAASGKWKDLTASIYLPILVFFNNGDEQDLYEAIDDFLILQKLPSPLHLLDKLNNYPTGAARVLLRDVLVPKVLSRGALWTKTPEEQRQMRTKMLQRLFALNVQDQELVVNELSKLEQERMLEEAYRNVEGPKFYLEFQDLTRRLAIIFEDIFERYCAYKLYEEKGGQLATEADLLELAKGGSGSKVATAKRTETSEMLLANMSTFAFTEFLWNSEKGINATLSTRIRHGSLENQLKRVFGAYGMLATRDLDGVYQCDRSVLDVLNAVNAGSRATICTAFIDFTHSINALYDGLVAEKLRIRVPDEVIPQLEDQGVPRKECGNEKSIIDFRGLFHDSAISRLKDVQLTTATALVSELHKIFIKNTHDAFSLLRTHMNTNVAVEVNTALQKLDDAIVSILGDGTERALLRQKVLSAKDGFVHDLSIIQKWFSEAAKIDSGIDTIKKLIATATRVIGFASNGKLGKLIEGDVVDMPIKPEAGVLLYEVVSILMRNIVQHSGLEAGQEVEYNFQISEAKKSVLTFCNKMTSHEVCDFAVASAKAHLDQPKDPRVLDRSPGGTGLARIRALLGQISHEHVSIQVSKLMDQPKFLVRVEF